MRTVSHLGFCSFLQLRKENGNVCSVYTGLKNIVDLELFMTTLATQQINCNTVVFKSTEVLEKWYGSELLSSTRCLQSRTAVECTKWTFCIKCIEKHVRTQSVSGTGKMETPLLKFPISEKMHLIQDCRHHVVLLKTRTPSSTSEGSNLVACGCNSSISYKQQTSVTLVSRLSPLHPVFCPTALWQSPWDYSVSEENRVWTESNPSLPHPHLRFS